jgi:hypothetical protein
MQPSSRFAQILLSVKKNEFHRIMKKHKAV